jgi:N-acetylmuramoyl-L-alanine amidase
MIYKLGSKGEVVKQIQRALAGAGLGVAVDGVYGHVTEEAVREFQKTRQLKVDGIVGPATMALLLACRFKKSKRRITDIVIHCTASKVSNDLTVEDIRRMHKKQGWADIGYHYLVYLDGTVHEGRDVDIAGAHAWGHNTYSIGVCYVGGVENRPGVAYDKLKAKDTRTDKQKAAMAEAGVEYVYHSIYELTYSCLIRLLRTQQT